MKSRRQLLLKAFVSLTFLLCGTCGIMAINTDYLPQSPSAARNIDIVNIESMDAASRLATVSLQGLVNRTQARIYAYGNQDAWILDLYQSRGFIDNRNNCSFQDLLNKYKAVPAGAVVYDPSKPYTVNVATNVAGVEDRVIISPDMIDMFRNVTGNSNIRDLRSNSFANQLEAFRWYKANIFPQQFHGALMIAKPLEYQHDVYRDYAVAFKMPAFWLPGPGDADYNTSYEQEIIQLFKDTPTNIPVIGFYPINNTGYLEMDGVQLAGYYGKFTLVHDWVGNLSFHSGIRPNRTEYKQTMPRSKQFRSYDPNKKYVALIMNESGDAPAYFLYTGFFPRQWNDPVRGQVAISYGITPSLRMLMPGILDYIYATQTANDFFFTAISGAGYCYPFEGYASLTTNSDNVKTDYYTLTANNMAALDFDMLGIYTHPASTWTQADRDIVQKYMLPMNGLRSIISGMHRSGYTGLDGNEMMGSVTVHHTLTMWSMVDYAWDNTSQDDAAVKYMEKEIKNYGYGGNFIQAMFYSWMYGPRRLNKLKQLMEPQGYEFVTLNEFDHLYRTANNLTSVKEISKRQPIAVYDRISHKIVFSETLTGTVRLINMQGVTLMKASLNQCRELTAPTSLSGVYLLQVESASGGFVCEKIII